MDVHGAALNHVKSVGTIALMKQVIILLQGLEHRDGGDVFEIRLSEAGEELATAQRIDKGNLLELRKSGRHGGDYSTSLVKKVNLPA
jgi:hypothetical protein